MSTERGGAQEPEDPDADPAMKTEKAGTQPDRAEGADDPSETRGG